MHGLHSDAKVFPLARVERRRVLRSLNLRYGDLSPVGRGYLDLYTRTRAKLDLADRFIEANGMLRDDGEPVPVMRLYTSLANSARLTLAKLEEHVRGETADPVEALNRWLSEREVVEEDADAPAAE